MEKKMLMYVCMHLQAAYHKRKQWKKHEKQNAYVCIYACMHCSTVCKEDFLISNGNEVGALGARIVLHQRVKYRHGWVGWMYECIEHEST